MSNRRRAYLPLYVGDYLADTQHLTTEENGAYLLLMFHYWTAGNLPDDEKVLRQIARLTPHKGAKILQKILKFFQKNSSENGGYSHARLDRELAKAIEISDKRAEAGRRGGEQKSKQLLPSIPYQYKHKKKKNVKKKKAAPLLDYCKAQGCEAQGRAFLDSRRALKKIPTERAEELLVAKLQGLQAASHPPGDVLDQSTINGWAGIFPLKTDNTGEKKLNPAAAGAAVWEQVYLIPDYKIPEFCRNNGLPEQAPKGATFDDWRRKIAHQLKAAA